MNILLIGSGGREHSIAKALSESLLSKKIFCTPGNPGIEKYADSVVLDTSDQRCLELQNLHIFLFLGYLGCKISSLKANFHSKPLLLNVPCRQILLRVCSFYLKLLKIYEIIYINYNKVYLYEFYNKKYIRTLCF